MAFTLLQDDDKNIITVTYEANTSYQDRVDLLYTLVKVLKDQPTINVLIDTTNAKTNMTKDEQLEYGKLLSDNAQYFQNNRTAILNREKESNPHPFIVVSAYSKGFGDIVEFENLDIAIAWINREI